MAGTNRSYKTVTIHYVDPNADCMLVLDDPFMVLLPKHSVVITKRINDQGILVPYNGYFRPINSFLLCRDENPNASKDPLKCANTQMKKRVKNLKDKTAEKNEDKWVLPQGHV